MFKLNKKRSKTNSKVLADLRRVLQHGRRVAFVENDEIQSIGIVVGIEEDRLLFEPMGQVSRFLSCTEIRQLECGVPWDFPAQDLRVVTEGKDTYLQCSIPPRININSRRDCFRTGIPVRSAKMLRFEVEGTEYETRILDLSQTGAQIRVLKAFAPLLANDQVINNAILELGEFGQKTVDFSVRWIFVEDDEGRAGLEFVGLSNEDLTDLQNLVCEIERDNIRRIKEISQ